MDKGCLSIFFSISSPLAVNTISLCFDADALSVFVCIGNEEYFTHTAWLVGDYFTSYNTDLHFIELKCENCPLANDFSGQ